VAVAPAGTETQRQLRLLVRIIDCLEQPALRFYDGLFACLSNEHALVQCCCILPCRICSVRFPEELLGVVRSKPAYDPGSPNERPRSSRWSLELRALPNFQHMRAPVTGIDAQIPQSLLGYDSIRTGDLDRSLVRLASDLQLTLVGRDIAQLDQERGRLRLRFGALNLELEQTAHHAELAQLPIHGSGLAERFSKSRVQLERVLKVLQRA
jgi:hypothetical protein